MPDYVPFGVNPDKLRESMQDYTNAAQARYRRLQEVRPGELNYFNMSPDELRKAFQDERAAAGNSPAAPAVQSQASQPVSLPATGVTDPYYATRGMTTAQKRAWSANRRGGDPVASQAGAALPLPAQQQNPIVREMMQPTRKDYDPSTLLMDAALQGKNDNGYTFGFGQRGGPAAQFDPRRQSPNDPTGLGARMASLPSAAAPAGPSPEEVQGLMSSARNATVNMNETFNNNDATKPTDYLAAARARQLASNAGGSYGDLPPLTSWSGPMFSRNKPTSVRTSAQLGPKETAHAADLAMRRQRAIANNGARISPSDSSPQAAGSRMLIAELLNQGQKPTDAVGGFNAAMNGTMPQAGLSPKMQAILASMDPQGYHEAQKVRPDLAGQAAMMTAQAQAEMMRNNPGALVPGFAEVDLKKKAQDAFDQGKLPPENWERFTPVLSQLVPSAYKYGFASSRKRDAMAAILAQYPKLDKTQLGAWYDSQYGSPWTN